MNTSAPATLPERAPRVGELVHVRSRQWLVEEVADPPAPGESPRVRLACADDDAQGQSLEVFWDYEIDRWILEEEGWAGLADKGFDPPRYFAAFFNTLRWHCTTATDANLFQAPFRAGITIDAYQMEPPRKALRLPRVNLFIADDTGLGKTIEAGLIARELLLRRKAKTIVAAVPPSVLEQWKSELEDPASFLKPPDADDERADWTGEEIEAEEQEQIEAINLAAEAEGPADTDAALWAREQQLLDRMQAITEEKPSSRSSAVWPR